MPGRRLQQGPQDESLCRRCQLEEPSIVVRTEPVCKSCFSKYVQTKVVKRMESFRVRHSEPGQERRLLLPLSLDACCLGLLQILSQHMKGQVEKVGRTGFRLCLLFVDDGLDNDANVGLEQVKARFPEHEYRDIALSHVLSYDGLSDLFPHNEEQSARLESHEERLRKLLASSKSATARQDLRRLLQQRLIVQSAKEFTCEAIIWSDSTTNLAERTLAETAKGRGLSLPWVIADGESPHGMPFYFPLREVLTKEIEAYVSFLKPPFDDGLIKSQAMPAVSTKNTTIDDLMRQYFETVERDYPSIVANVVRTTGKLQSTPLTQVEQQCELCNMPLEGNAPEKSRLCHGCIRTIPSVAT